jgi:hypothetical protein
MSRISNFLSTVTQNDFAQSNRFRVLFGAVPAMGNFNSFKNLTFYCEAAEFPGRSFQVTDQKIYGPTLKNPVVTQYSEITLSLYCDKKMNQKKFFDDWMNAVNPMANSGFDFNYRNDYITEVTIQQFSGLKRSADDETLVPTYSCRLYEAYPTNVAALNATWADDNFHRVSVTLAYRYWVGHNRETDSDLPFSASGPSVPSTLLPDEIDIAPDMSIVTDDINNVPNLPENVEESVATFI